MVSVSAESPQVTDVALSQRLERAEAKASAAYVESRAHTAPSLGAEWRDFDGTYAMFDGVGSPLSQTFGFGLFSPPTSAQLETIESFFRDRGAEVFHEVSPLADPAVLGLMAERGYHPIELTSVMRLRLTTDRSPSQRQLAPQLVVRRVEAGGEGVVGGAEAELVDDFAGELRRNLVPALRPVPELRYAPFRPARPTSTHPGARLAITTSVTNSNSCKDAGSGLPVVVSLTPPLPLRIRMP